MSERDLGPDSSGEPWPPAYPPEPPRFEPPTPPDEAPGPSDAQPLTDVRWTIGNAVWLIAAVFGLTIASGGVAAWLLTLSLAPGIFTLWLTCLLGGVYVAVFGILWLVVRAKGVPFAPAFGVRPARWSTLVLATLGATLVGRTAAAVWTIVVERLGLELPGAGVDPTELFPPGPGGILALLIVAGVMAPVAEELVFRGVLLSSIELRFGVRNAVLWSSLVFALVHITPFTIPPIFALSLFLGWLFVRTRSLLVCIVAHAGFNITGLAAIYAAKSAGLL